MQARSAEISAEIQCRLPACRGLSLSYLRYVSPPELAPALDRARCLPFVSSVQFARRDCSENLLYMDSRLRQDAQDPWLQTQRKHTRNRRAGKGRNRLAPSKRCTAVYGQDFSQ